MSVSSQSCLKCCKVKEVPGEIFKQQLCKKCFADLTHAEAKPAKPTFADIAEKKLEHLSRSSSVKLESFDNEKDIELAERLKNLKKDQIVPTEDELAERVAKLKGIEPSKYKAPPIQVYRPPDMRTAVQKATDLMKQVALEAELDSRLVKPEDEIAARLARLRDEKFPEKAKSPEEEFLSKYQAAPTQVDVFQTGIDFQKELAEVKALQKDSEFKNLMKSMDIQKETGSNEDSEDEDAAAERLINQLLGSEMDVDKLDSLSDEDSSSKSEGKNLATKMNVDSVNDGTDKDKKEDELPWCVICTEDAKVRCFDCDSDIFCWDCFKEGHQSLGITNHSTCPYFSDKNTAL